MNLNETPHPYCPDEDCRCVKGMDETCPGIARTFKTHYIAEFLPQAWVRDYAIPVDPEGPTKWDATEFVTSEEGWGTIDRQEWLKATLEHGDYDDILREDPNAPQWIQEWSGPFETFLEEEVPA